jgi:hypothetical protein
MEYNIATLDNLFPPLLSIRDDFPLSSMDDMMTIVTDVDTSMSLLASSSSFECDRYPALVMRCDEVLDGNLAAEEDNADDQEVVRVFDLRPLLVPKKKQETIAPFIKRDRKPGLELPSGPIPTMRTRRQYQGLNIKPPALFPLRSAGDGALITKPRNLMWRKRDKKKKKDETKMMTIPVRTPLTPLCVALPPLELPAERPWRNTMQQQQQPITVFGM